MNVKLDLSLDVISVLLKISESAKKKLGQKLHSNQSYANLKFGFQLNKLWNSKMAKKWLFSEI